MLHRREPIRRVTHDSLDTAYFFFSFESDLPETAPRHLSGGPQKGSGQVSQKSLATPVFIGQNESCLLLKVPPCHDTKSCIDWPVSAVKLVDDLAGESPASASFPVGTVVISGDGAGDQTVESPEVNVLDGWMRIRSAPTGGQAKQQVVAQANRS